MIKVMDFNKMGLVQMSNLELEETDGGSFLHWLAVGLGIALGVGFIIASGVLVYGAAIGLLSVAGIALNA